LLLDRLNTRNLLGRKQFHLPSYACATSQCDEEKTLIHLFWACPFAKVCWNYVCPTRGRNLSVLESIEDLKNKIHLTFEGADDYCCLEHLDSEKQHDLP
jgi:hypothetical protein